MDFITSFDDSTGTVQTIDKNYDKKMVFTKDLNGSTLKIIKESACSRGKVTEIDMSNTEITTIRSYAFYSCSNLISVLFPLSLVEISDNSFLEAGLININIPKNVKIMSGFAWNQCPNIKCFTVDASNENFASDSCFIFNKEKTTLIRAPKTILSEKDIPNFDRLTTIGDFALTSTSIRYFTCTSNLTAMKRRAFHAMNNIIEINLTLGRFDTIYDNCFSGNSAKRIYLPSTVKTIKDNAFSSLYNLKTLMLYKDVETISKNAFNDCSKLEYIYYFGSFNQSAVSCISEKMKPKVLVTLDYPYNTFCKLDVKRGWERNKFLTCKCIKRCSTITGTIFFYIMISRY